MKSQILFLTIIIFIAACTNTEIGNSKDIEPNAIAQVIDVEYKESETPKSRIRFRVSGDNGTTLVLNQPASVSFNNKLLQVDSSGYYGAYYAAPQVENGNNTFVYTAKDGKKFSNSFQYNGFGLAKPFANVISKSNDLQVTIIGLNNNDKVNIAIADTANATQNIDEEVALQNGIATIKANQLSALKSGPVKINIHYKASHSLKEGTDEGGKINYNFELKQRTANLQ
jgi:hypothetical protein